MGKTKAEEYDALIRIRGILKDFDPEDTYIGKAFEGCVELAKENINNDRRASFRSQYENRDRDATKLDEILTKTTEKLRKSEEARVDLVKELNQKNDTIARLEDAKNQLSKELEEVKAAYAKLEFKLERANETADGLKQTILELKAELYDLMVSRKEVIHSDEEG